MLKSPLTPSKTTCLLCHKLYQMLRKGLAHVLSRPLMLGLATSLLVAHHSTYAQEVGLDDGEHVPLLNVKLGFDANYSTGNFDQVRLNGRGAVFKRWGERLALLNSFHYRYMKNGDIKFSDDFRDVLILTLNPLKALQVYGIGLYHQSFTRFIDRRWMTGLGGAYSLMRSSTNQIKFGTGLAYEWTRLDGRPPPFTPPDGYGVDCFYLDNPDVARSCDRQMWRIIPRLVTHHELADRRLIIDSEALWVIDPQNLKDERIYLSLTTAVPIVSWLRVYAHYDLSFESIVLKHRAQTDSHVSFGVQITAADPAPSRPARAR